MLNVKYNLYFHRNVNARSHVMLMYYYLMYSPFNSINQYIFNSYCFNDTFTDS